MESDREFVDRQVARVAPLLVVREGHPLPPYEVLRRIVDATLRACVAPLGAGIVVQSRTKPIPSFAEKCLRKRQRYAQPAMQLTDLCGARVVTESKAQIAPICAAVRDWFEIDEANTEDAAERLQAQQFGYQSMHFIVSLKAGPDYPGVGALDAATRETVLPQLFERRDAARAREEGLPIGPVFKAEVQVRTLLQHAWAALVHDNLYKTDLGTRPRHLDREAGRIAALLEDADDSFVHLLDGVESYRSCYGAYMTPEKIAEERGVLAIVREQAPHDAALAHRIGRLAMAAEGWAEAVAALERVPEPRAPALRRDLGWSLWQAGQRKRGRRELEAAAKADPRDADARCWLGDTWYAKDTRTALGWYEGAFTIAPDHPGAAARYAECHLVCHHDPHALAMLRPTFVACIHRSLERARHGMHLPWGLYEVGLFHLLLAADGAAMRDVEPGEPYESLAAYARAVALSTKESPLLDAYRSLTDVADALDRHPLVTGINMSRRLLLAAVVAKRIASGMPAGGAVAAFLRHKGRDPDPRKSNERARRLDGGDSLVTPQAGSEPLFRADRRVVIVAGGCDAAAAARLGAYRALIHQAFEGYEGDVVSGGTTAGIAGIVGDLDSCSGLRRKIAYLPSQLPVTDHLHPGYDVVRHSATARYGRDCYSPMDAIQVWIDLLASGVAPSEVRLLGINGGALAAFEYRLALVMGARVGVLADSGREATRLAEDPDWVTHARLLAMPTDLETVRAFLQPARPTGLAPAEREAMARRVHERYRAEERSRQVGKEPNMADWDELRPDLKRSNLAQVDHIVAKLERVGLALRRVEGRPLRRFELGDEQLRLLAEMEHGRWNVERLSEGWRLGPKDVVAKRSPYLVGWDELPDAVKEKDMAAVRGLPDQLMEVGYEIHDPRAGSRGSGRRAHGAGA